MTSFERVYERFLSTVSIDFPNLTDYEIEQELFNWTVLASSYFKFPRVSLDFTVYDHMDQGPNGEIGAYFLHEVTEKEIAVIVEYMKLVHSEIRLSDSKKYDMYYEDANLKLPSQSAMITQMNRTHENQSKEAKRVENNYYRTRNNRPTIGEIWNR